MAIAKDYSENVFINCPFDDKFLDLFYAKVFCVIDCGFRARCAQETVDSGEVRIEKIKRIIRQCKYGIHDISRTDPCEKTKLPRFNMPLELGIFLGARYYGNSEQKRKICLITDIDKYRFQKFMSDISGQDIHAHSNNPEKLIKLVSSWLKDSSKKKEMSGGKYIVQKYNRFREELPKFCNDGKTSEEELTFSEYTNFVYTWLERQRLVSATIPVLLQNTH